jgi:hypothetical protein
MMLSDPDMQMPGYKISLKAGLLLRLIIIEINQNER